MSFLEYCLITFNFTEDHSLLHLEKLGAHHTSCALTPTADVSSWTSDLLKRKAICIANIALSNSWLHHAANAMEKLRFESF